MDDDAAARDAIREAFREAFLHGFFRGLRAPVVTDPARTDRAPGDLPVPWPVSALPPGAFLGPADHPGPARLPVPAAFVLLPLLGPRVAVLLVMN